MSIPADRRGDPVKQEAMSRLLRDLMSQVAPMFPSCAFIFVGIPSDRTPRVVHNLDEKGNAYAVMEFMVKEYRTDAVEHGQPGGRE